MYQMSVHDSVVEWAQRKTGQKHPSTFFNDILIRAMADDLKHEVVAEVIDLDAATIKSRWRAIGLAPDALDHYYTRARDYMISTFDSELEALESAEARQRHGGYDEGGTISNMRAYLCWWYSEVLKTKAAK